MTEPAIDVQFQDVPSARVAGMTGRAAGFGSAQIGPVVAPMFSEVAALLAAADVETGPAIATYAADDSGDGVIVTAGFEVEPAVESVQGLEIHLLPPAHAAVATHRGAVATIDRSWSALADRVREAGAEIAGPAREIYLTPGERPQEEWVTELVQPVAPRT